MTRGRTRKEEQERNEGSAISRSGLLLNRGLPDAIPPVSESCCYLSRAKGVSPSKTFFLGLPWWSSGWESPHHSGDMGSVPGVGRYHMQGAPKPVCHNLWNPSTPGPLGHKSWACELQPPKPACSRACVPQQKNKRSHCNENPEHRN